MRSRAALLCVALAAALSAAPDPASRIAAAGEPPEAASYRITLTLSNVAVSDALAAVADRFGLELIASGVDGRTVSLALADRTLDEALDAILSGSDLACLRIGTTLRVVPGAHAVSQSFPLEHASASRVAELLKQGAGDAQVVGDDASNVLHVSGKASLVQEVAALVRWLDREPGQVKIRARVLEVTLGKEDALGVDWNALFPRRGETSVDVGTGLFPAGSGATTTITISNDGSGAGLDAIVRGIATRTRSRLLSSPEIATSNNVPAKILVGERVPYTKATTATQTGATLQEIEFVDVGVKLEATPQVADDGTVALDVSVEISEVLDKEVAGTPRIGTREAHSRVVLDSGDVLMIGGLMRVSRTKLTRGVPLLGDVPIVGRLFRHEGVREERTELVVLVSPDVIDAESRAEGRRLNERFDGELESGGGD